MSQVKVLVVALSLALTTSIAFGQQGVQGSPQQGFQQRSQQAYQSAGGSMAGSQQQIKQLSQMVDQDKAKLQKCIDKAKSQVKNGQVIGAAFAQEQAAGGSSSGQGLAAHVFVLADNQIHDIVVDAKNDKVLDTQTRQMIGNPWQLGNVSGQGNTGGALTLATAQDIGNLAKQDSVDLKKVIDKADDQVKGNVIGAFLVLPSQVGPAVQQQSSSGQQANLLAKVFVVDKSDQLHAVIVDAKNDKVLTTETQQSLQNPWQAQSRFGEGTGGTMQPGQRSAPQQGRGPQQPGQSGAPQPGHGGGAGY